MDNFGQPTFTNNLTSDEPYVQKASDLYGIARTKFIRKVYTILMIQLGITVLMTLFSMYSVSYYQFQIDNPWLIIMCAFTALVLEIYIMCCGGGRKPPSNLILLGIFTFCQGYIVSFICSVTGQSSGNEVVLLAAIYTLIIVVACTLYAYYTQQDYTTSSGIIIILIVVLVVLGIMTMFTSSPFVYNLYCAVGVLLFGIYLIIDTQMIVGGKNIQLTVDQYVLAAMLLYIDIIQIFLYILQMLGKKQ